MKTGETRDPALEAAMDWLLKIEAAPRDAALRARFEAWLAADQANKRAWDRARQTWNIAGEARPAYAGQWTPGAARRIRRNAPHAAPSRRKLRRYGAGLAAAAAAACLALVLGPAAMLHLRADYATSTAELGAVTLADGTRVELGPRSAIADDFTAGQRHVVLLAGEAWFDVAHDPDRPFVVRAGGLDATVLGTAFEVRLGHGTTSVAVERGRVGVRAGQVDALLNPGDTILVDRASGEGVPGGVPPDAVASWRTGTLYANDVTVAEMIERLNRYKTGRIVITDEALAQRRVTGSYNARDPDAAIEALLYAGGGRARRITPWLTLLSAE